MLQNLCKTLGFKKNMVYKIPPGGGGGKPYPASGLVCSVRSPYHLTTINALSRRLCYLGIVSLGASATLYAFWPTSGLDQVLP